MAWLSRDGHLKVLLISAAAVAACVSTTIPDPDGSGGGQGGTGVTAGSGTTAGSGGGSGGQSCIPGITCPTSGGKGGSSGGSNGTSGSTSTSGTGPGSGGSGLAGGGGTDPTGSGGTGLGTSGSDPSGGTGLVGSGATAGTNGGGTVLGTIQVSADALDRDHSIVRFPFAAGAEKNLVLKDAQGNTIPLQVSLADNNASFVLPLLAAGQTVTYTIEELAAALPDGITSTVGDDQQLHYKLGSTEIFRWMLVPDNFRNKPANDVRAGYIYPLLTPQGLNVTDDYAEDHPHMHGIWSAWTLTTFRGNKVDFWNGYDNSGHVDLESMERAWGGPVHAGLIAHMKHEAIKYDPRVKVLHEKWVVTLYKTHDAPAPYYVFDVDSVQETATTDPLVLEQYTYGGFGYRGSGEWQNAAGSFLTSEGLTRTNGDGTRAKWVAQYGPISGKAGGYAAFDHPTNFRHPQGLRLHPTNPYWCFSPIITAAGGRTTIEVGVPYVSRYRVVSFDGNADAAFLEKLWQDFATPPTVTVLQ